MLGAKWGLTTDRYFKAESGWKEPLAWNLKAEKAGERHRVFCASLADVFEDRRALDVHRERLWALVERTPSLDWLLLTKRIEHVGSMVPWGDAWPTNVWLGCTAENQRRVDERLPHLLSYPAVVRFISAEPGGLEPAGDLSRFTPQPGSSIFHLKSLRVLDVERQQLNSQSPSAPVARRVGAAPCAIAAAS